jgi:hypothetical protein
MISVKQILYWTLLHRKSIVAKARSVSLTFKKVEYVEENGVQFKRVDAKAMGESDVYDLTMFFQGKGPTSKVWASCSCAYFLYHCEVALIKRGSSDQNYSNGKLPKITNPRLVAHSCKHIVAALQRGAFMLEPKKVVKKPEVKKPEPKTTVKKPAGKPAPKNETAPNKSGQLTGLDSNLTKKN